MRKALLTTALVSIFALSACGTSSEEAASTPETLIGEWRQTNAENTDILMVASVSPETIRIRMETRDSSNLYWLGTFDGNKNPTKPFDLVSVGDKDVLAGSIFASQNETKAFSYKDGAITYEFTIMGSTRTIRLEK